MMSLEKPDIVETLRREGAELKHRGRYFWTLCLLHQEKTPSLKIDPDKQTFFCFGCGQGGDVIAFIQKYRGLSFKEALQYLGITQGRPTPEAVQKAKRERHKRELIRGFRKWEQEYHGLLCRFLRLLEEAKRMARTMEDVEGLASFYHTEPIANYHLEILESGDEEAKLELFGRAVKWER